MSERTYTLPNTRSSKRLLNQQNKTVENEFIERPGDVTHTSQEPGMSTDLHFSSAESTPVNSEIHLVVESGIPTEEEIKNLGWKIYTSKDQELRNLLHIEYLTTYIDENIVPKGLTINLKPSIQNNELLSKWDTVLKSTSMELMKLLIGHYHKELERVTTVRTVTENSMDRIWSPEDKQAFTSDIDETLAIREGNLRAVKDKKLERDRRLDISRPTVFEKDQNNTRHIGGDYSNMLKQHINNKMSQDARTKEGNADGRTIKQREKDQEHTEKPERRGINTPNSPAFYRGQNGVDRQPYTQIRGRRRERNFSRGVRETQLQEHGGYHEQLEDTNRRRYDNKYHRLRYQHGGNYMFQRDGQSKEFYHARNNQSHNERDDDRYIESEHRSCDNTKHGEQFRERNRRNQTFLREDDRYREINCGRFDNTDRDENQFRDKIKRNHFYNGDDDQYIESERGRWNNPGIENDYRKKNRQNHFYKRNDDRHIDREHRRWDNTYGQESHVRNQNRGNDFFNRDDDQYRESEHGAWYKTDKEEDHFRQRNKRNHRYRNNGKEY